MQYGLTLIFLGILAVPSLILSKKPNAKEYLDKITPYQGWIGVGFAFWGIWTIIHFISNISLIGVVPIYWILLLLVGLVETALGFILGYGLIAKYVLSKNETASKKGEEVLAKLAPLQGKLGILSIILGAIFVVIAIISKV